MKRILVGLSVVLACVVGFAVWWTVSLSPVNSSNNKPVTFVVKKGDGVKEISKNLKNAGLIRDQIAFFLWERLFVKNSPQAGTFQLSPSLSAKEIAQKLILGTEDVWITIPEGWRCEEIKEYLLSRGFEQDKKMRYFRDPCEADEGKMFPDTYLVPKESTVDQIVILMTSNYVTKVSFPITRDQLIVASLVEREAKTGTDRSQIASVIYNRLEIGMKLDVDATVQYALGKSENWWKKELTLEDLKVKSPYNTYLNAGLPPTPICNPGLAAIEAAVNPAKTGYLYYMHDSSGLAHFAKNLQ